MDQYLILNGEKSKSWGLPLKWLYLEESSVAVQIEVCFHWEQLLLTYIDVILYFKTSALVGLKNLNCESKLTSEVSVQASFQK